MTEPQWSRALRLAKVAREAMYAELNASIARCRQAVALADGRPPPVTDRSASRDRSPGELAAAAEAERAGYVELTERGER